MIEGQDGDDFDRAAVRRKMAKQGYWYGATCTVIAAATVVAAVLAWSGASVFILLILTLPFSVFAWMMFHGAKRWKNGGVV